PFGWKPVWTMPPPVARVSTARTGVRKVGVPRLAGALGARYPTTSIATSSVFVEKTAIVPTFGPPAGATPVPQQLKASGSIGLSVEAFGALPCPGKTTR